MTPQYHQPTYNPGGKQSASSLAIWYEISSNEILRWRCHSIFRKFIWGFSRSGNPGLVYTSACNDAMAQEILPKLLLQLLGNGERVKRGWRKKKEVWDWSDVTLWNCIPLAYSPLHFVPLSEVAKEKCGKMAEPHPLRPRNFHPRFTKPQNLQFKGFFKPHFTLIRGWAKVQFDLWKLCYAARAFQLSNPPDTLGYPTTMI